MDNINGDDYFYHGLCGFSICVCNHYFVIDRSLKQLESIFRTGGIYSRNYLKRFEVNYDHRPVYNGDDYISLCIKEPFSFEFEGINEGFESAFVNYVFSNKISLMIDKDIVFDHEFRTYNKQYLLPGERQVKDKIDISSIKGIMISFDSEDYTYLSYIFVRELLTKYNLNIPLYNRNYEIISFPELKLK